MCHNHNINTGKNTDSWFSATPVEANILPGYSHSHHSVKNAIFNITQNLIIQQTHTMMGKKAGFLTEHRRDYLKSSQTEREKTYSESQRKHFDDAILEQATLALDDLILIAEGYDKENVQRIFSKEAIEKLVGTLMERIGLDEAGGRERYYEIFLKAIEERIHQKYKELDRFFKLESTHYPVMPSKPAYRDVKAYMRK
jgi:hypothetical protein